MTKYKIGDEFQLKQGEDTVKLKIIFIPPVDGYGVQYYLCEVFSIYANGGDKHFYSLTREEEIDNHFKIRQRAVGV